MAIYKPAGVLPEARLVRTEVGTSRPYRDFWCVSHPDCFVMGTSANQYRSQEGYSKWSSCPRTFTLSQEWFKKNADLRVSEWLKLVNHLTLDYGWGYDLSQEMEPHVRLHIPLGICLRPLPPSPLLSKRLLREHD